MILRVPDRFELRRCHDRNRDLVLALGFGQPRRLDRLVATSAAPAAGPLFGGWEPDQVRPAEEAASGGEGRQARWYDISPGYFQTLGVPILRGRDFNHDDSGESTPVVIVNQSLADRLWPGQDPLGRELWLELHGQSRQVVGVVADVPPLDPDATVEPEMFWPQAQYIRPFTHFLLRTEGDPEAVRGLVAERIREVDANLQPGPVRSYSELLARQLGLGDDPKVAEGCDLDGLDERQLRDLVRDVTVFARTTPEHKLQLVEALQSGGSVIAMTGDGVNDAPALKQADVGVAMGMKGTEAAKQAGAVVLADDNFASIAHAVEEGRTVYDNLKKTVTFLLPINGGESLTLLLAVLLGIALPILPLAQLPWHCLSLLRIRQVLSARKNW